MFACCFSTRREIESPILSSSTPALDSNVSCPGGVEEAVLNDAAKQHPSLHHESTSSSTSNARLQSKLRVDYKELTFHQLIGKGSFKAVYRGRWNNTSVAILCMRKGGMVTEARVLQRMSNHPNLVQFYRWATDKNSNEYMVMEYVRGGALDKLLLSKGDSLRTRVKLAMCEQICSAMCELSSENVTHRDLAVRNILVADMDPVHVKVSDFGLARVHGSLMASGQPVSIPIRWSPPEVLKEYQWSEKSDVWSFGVTMWEIFSGANEPYAQKSDAQVYQAIMSHEVLPRPPKCPRQVYLLMIKCWDMDPAARPTFDEILQTFKGWRGAFLRDKGCGTQAQLAQTGKLQRTQSHQSQTPGSSPGPSTRIPAQRSVLDPPSSRLISDTISRRDLPSCSSSSSVRRPRAVPPLEHCYQVPEEVDRGCTSFISLPPLDRVDEVQGEEHLSGTNSLLVEDQEDTASLKTVSSFDSGLLEPESSPHLPYVPPRVVGEDGSQTQQVEYLDGSVSLDEGIAIPLMPSIASIRTSGSMSLKGRASFNWDDVPAGQAPTILEGSLNIAAARALTAQLNSPPSNDLAALRHLRRSASTGVGASMLASPLVSALGWDAIGGGSNNGVGATLDSNGSSYRRPSGDRMGSSGAVTIEMSFDMEPGIDPLTSLTSGTPSSSLAAAGASVGGRSVENSRGSNSRSSGRTGSPEPHQNQRVDFRLADSLRVVPPTSRPDGEPFVELTASGLTALINSNRLREPGFIAVPTSPDWLGASYDSIPKISQLAASSANAADSGLVRSGSGGETSEGCSSARTSPRLRSTAALNSNRRPLSQRSPSVGGITGSGVPGPNAPAALLLSSILLVRSSSRLSRSSAAISDFRLGDAPMQSISTGEYSPPSDESTLEALAIHRPGSGHVPVIGSGTSSPGRPGSNCGVSSPSRSAGMVSAGAVTSAVTSMPPSSTVRSGGTGGVISGSSGTPPSSNHTHLMSDSSRGPTLEGSPQYSVDGTVMSSLGPSFHATDAILSPIGVMLEPPALSQQHGAANAIFAAYQHQISARGALMLPTTASSSSTAPHQYEDMEIVNSRVVASGTSLTSFVPRRHSPYVDLQALVRAQGNPPLINSPGGA